MTIIGKNIIWKYSIGSTNNYLKNCIQSDQILDNGDIVVAADQTHGKGRGTNTWESEPGKNLTFSFFLKPDFLNAEDQFLLNKAVSLGIFNFVKSTIPDQRISIKWPNDIYINDKKVAGILIDNTIAGNKLEYSTIGIGININQQNFNKNLPNPVSLFNILNKKLDLEKCLDSLCNFLNVEYSHLLNSNLSKLVQSYHSALYKLNEYYHFKVGNKIMEAKIIGVSDLGKLQVELLGNGIEEFDYSEIKFII